jgi:hypothetical protein
MQLVRTLAKFGLVAGVAVTSLALAGGSAQAADPSPAPPKADAASLATLKADLTKRIDLRLAALARDTTAINAAKHLAPADKTTLTNLDSQDTAAMTALKTKVAGETTVAAIRADAASMVNDYRIFILVGPKVRLTIAGDAEHDAITRLQTAHDKLAGLVAQAKAAGHDTTAAEQSLADMAAAIGKATTDTNGQVAAVLAIQPGPEGAGIRAKVAAVRTALGTGRADLKSAVADARKVTAFLKGLKKPA